MRDIKCRGLRVDNKEFVHGWYFESFTGIAYIIVMHDHILGITEMYEVVKETVGQFTGLLDKNGKDVYEGDIVRYGNEFDFLDCEVEFEFGCFCVGRLNLKDTNLFDSIVIGNIHANPELLESPNVKVKEESL